MSNPLEPLVMAYDREVKRMKFREPSISYTVLKNTAMELARKS